MVIGIVFALVMYWVLLLVALKTGYVLLGPKTLAFKKNSVTKATEQSKVERTKEQLESITGDGDMKHD